MKSKYCSDSVKVAVNKIKSYCKEFTSEKAIEYYKSFSEDMRHNIRQSLTCTAEAYILLKSEFEES